MDSISLDSFEGELVAEMKEEQAHPTEDFPFRILLLGDWSGRANRQAFSSSEELKTWRPLLVDRDNLDQLITRLGVRLNIPITDDGSQSVTIRFGQLDDFHPDRIFERLDIFESLRGLRARLEDGKTFAEAAAEVRQWAEFAQGETESPEAKETGAADEMSKAEPISQSSVLDQILAREPGHAPATKLSQPTEQVSAEISQLAEAAVKPYLTPNIEADQQQMTAAVDSRIAGNMRAILHHRDFQALESAWRSLDFLVSRLETGTDLKLYLLDISFVDFNADLQSADDVRSTALYKLLVEQTVDTEGGIPWAVVAGNYTFNLTTADQKLVERILTIAQLAGAPFVAGTTSHLLGCESLAATPDPDEWQLPLASDTEESWKGLTSSSFADYVGFALPHFLLRLPYGKDTEPTEEFEFEEFGDADGTRSRHESYLWANPAFAVAYLLGKGFAEEGWSFRPSDYLEIDNLPMHIYERNGESEIKPCAEVLLTVRAAERIIDRGLMPLLSMKNSDTIRLGMYQSIKGDSLRGRWSRKDGRRT